MITFHNLIKGTSYKARIVAYNDRGVGTFTDLFTAQTRVDRKFMMSMLITGSKFMHILPLVNLYDVVAIIIHAPLNI